MCNFRENMSRGYIRYCSYTDGDKCIGFYKRNGRPIRFVQGKALNQTMNLLKKPPHNIEVIDHITSPKVKSHSLSIHNLSNHTNSANKILTINQDSNNSKNTTIRSKHKRKKSSNKSIINKTKHSKISAGSLESSNENIPVINDDTIKEIRQTVFNINNNNKTPSLNENNNQQSLDSITTNIRSSKLFHNNIQKQQNHKIRHSQSRQLHSRKNIHKTHNFQTT